MDEIKTGTIKNIIKNKGFGFIKAEDKSDIFFHASGVMDNKFDELVEGMEVEYIVTEGKKGLKAIGIVTL